VASNPIRQPLAAIERGPRRTRYARGQIAQVDLGSKYPLRASRGLGWPLAGARWSLPGAESVASPGVRPGHTLG
jgi:hypothetical protein